MVLFLYYRLSLSVILHLTVNLKHLAICTYILISSFTKIQKYTPVYRRAYGRLQNWHNANIVVTWTLIKYSVTAEYVWNNLSQKSSVFIIYLYFTQMFLECVSLCRLIYYIKRKRKYGEVMETKKAGDNIWIISYLWCVSYRVL